MTVPSRMVPSLSVTRSASTGGAASATAASRAIPNTGARARFGAEIMVCVSVYGGVALGEGATMVPPGAPSAQHPAFGMELRDVRPVVAVTIVTRRQRSFFYINPLSRSELEVRMRSLRSPAHGLTLVDVCIVLCMVCLVV